MKKVFAVALAMTVAVGMLAGCGSNDSAQGGAADSAITVVSREDGSGTRGAFIELFGIEEKNDAGEKIDNTTDTAEITNSTAVMMTTVAGNDNAIGYVSLGSLNDSVKVICVINTVCGPVCDSEIRFYSTRWEQLAESDFIRLPSVEAFYLPVDTLTDEAYVAIREKADMELVKATLSEDKSIISFTYTTPEYLAKTEREKLAVYIKKEPVIYEWKEGKFSAFP